MSEDLPGTCIKLVSHGESLGADEVEIFAVQQQSIEAVIENNEVKLAKHLRGASTGIRVFKDRTLGFASANTLDIARLMRVVGDAVALSRNAPSDDNNSMPNPKAVSEIPGLVDDAIQECTEDEVIERASRMLTSAREVDSRVTVDGGRFEVLVGEKAIANSHGIEAVEEFTAIVFDIGAHASDGGVISSTDYRFDGARSLNGDSSEELARELAKSSVESLSTGKMESGIGSIILSPISAIELLLSPILFSVDSNNVQKRLSRFASRHDEPVASNMLTITDDGTVGGGLSSSAFDREGCPHTPLKLIEKGVLRSFLYNQYTANREGRESTGHASGGPRGVPSIDSTNLKVAEGTHSLDELVSSIERGLLVERFSGRVDPVSGDFSGIAKSSREISGGELHGVLRETMISGNVFDALNGIRDMTRETRKIMDIRLPYIAIDDVSIIGG